MKHHLNLFNDNLYQFLVQNSPKDILNFRMVNADRVAVVVQKSIGVLDQYSTCPDFYRDTVSVLKENKQEQ